MFTAFGQNRASMSFPLHFALLPFLWMAKSGTPQVRKSKIVSLPQLPFFPLCSKFF